MGKVILKVLFVVATLCFTKGVADAGGKAYWQENGVCVCESTFAGGRDALDIVSDSCGGAIVVWSDNRGSQDKVCVQRIDSIGNILWGTGGVIVGTGGVYTDFKPKAVTDQKNGLIVTWVCEDAGYAARVDSAGTKMWQTTIRGPLGYGNTVDYPVIVGDGAGGAVIAWIEQYFTGMNLDSTFLRVQRVGADGTIRWDNDGVNITDSTCYHHLRMINDGPKGVVLSRSHSKSGNMDNYVQYIDSSGVLLWNAAGVPVCTSQGDQGTGFLVPSHCGWITTWMDGRRGDYDVYSQRIDTCGNSLWDINGIPVSLADSIQSVHGCISDGAGGNIAVWVDHRNGKDIEDIYTQRISNNGTLVWVQDGIFIVTADTGNSSYVAVSLTSDLQHGTVLSWKDHRAGNWDIYAQRVDSLGALQWGDSALGVGTRVENEKWGPVITTDGKGGGIVAWATNIGPKGYVYVQRINDDTTGVQEKRVTRTQGGVLIAQPNPFLRKTVISYHMPAVSGRSETTTDYRSRATLEIHDLAGRLLEVSCDGIVGENLSPGIYFARSGEYKPIKLTKIGGVP
jgi:hypothetical protein